jgi:hypothetical protein
MGVITKDMKIYRGIPEWALEQLPGLRFTH